MKKKTFSQITFNISKQKNRTTFTFFIKNFKIVIKINIPMQVMLGLLLSFKSVNKNFNAEVSVNSDMLIVIHLPFKVHIKNAHIHFCFEVNVPIGKFTIKNLNHFPKGKPVVVVAHTSLNLINTKLWSCLQNFDPSFH